MFSKLLSVNRKRVSQHFRQLKCRRPRFEPLEPRTLLSIGTVQPMPLPDTNSGQVATDPLGIPPASTSAVAMTDANPNFDAVVTATAIKTVVTMEWSKTSGITIRWKGENGDVIPDAQVRFGCFNAPHSDPNLGSSPENWRFPFPTYSKSGVQRVDAKTVLRMVSASGDPDGPYNYAWAMVIPWPMTDNPHVVGWTELAIPDKDDKPDLVVTDFKLEQDHSTYADSLHRATVTIQNDGVVKSKACDVQFYAMAYPSECVRGALLLGKYHAPVLDPGESITIQRKINDPVYLKNNFKNGYYIGVHVDPKNQIPEKDDHNNHKVLNMANSGHLAGDSAYILAALAGMSVGPIFSGSGCAATHLMLWLSGQCEGQDWMDGTAPSDELEITPEFDHSADRGTAFLDQQLAKSVNTTGNIFTDLDVGRNAGRRVFGTPVLNSNLDLYYGIAGTQGSEGSFSNIHITSSKKVKGKTFYTFEADLSITYYDSYNFDEYDALKGHGIGACARHLEMSGFAKGFPTSITGVTTVQGLFSSNKAIKAPGISQVASAAISDMTAGADAGAMARAMGPWFTQSGDKRILSAANDAALLAVMYQQGPSA